MEVCSGVCTMCMCAPVELKVWGLHARSEKDQYNHLLKSCREK